MQEESTLYENRVSVEHKNSNFYDPKLLITTATMRLYRISKDGKYFLIKTTKDNSERQLQMLKREYELSIGCSHPHIVHVYTYEDNLEVGPAIVMEYIEGCTLEEHLAGNISKSERNRLFEELLSAVGYLHKQGIIHNDLKPENILISHTDHSLKLIDFGLADSDSHFALKRLGCTLRYASPELREQSCNIDARSDIYSIGVIMQQLVGNSAIAKRCTQSNPDKRYANIEALQRAWRNRHRPYFVAAAIALLLLIILPTTLYIHTNSENRELRQRLDTKQQEQNIELQQQKEMTTQIERDMATIYNRMQDSISTCPYREFLPIYLARAQTLFSSYREDIDHTIRPLEHTTIAVIHYENLFSKHMMDLVSFLEKRELQLPSYKDVEPKEHWPFYDSLHFSFLPYRPHPEKVK